MKTGEVPVTLTAMLAICACVSAANAQSGGLCADNDGDGYFAGPGCTSQPLDCNDQNPDVHPGAVELCNGWDDNCDGVIDEGCNICPNFGTTRRVLVNLNASEPRIAAADNSWAFIFNDGIEGFPEAVTRLDSRGQELSPETVFTESLAKNQNVCWTGSEIASTWDHFGNPNADYGMFFRRLGPWGKPPSDRVTVSTTDAFSHGGIWNGFEHAILWSVTDNTGSIGTQLGRLDAAGGVLDNSTYLSHERGHFNDAFEWNGSGFGWSYAMTDLQTGRSEVYFQLVSATGALIGGATRITNHSTSPAGTYADTPIVRSMGPNRGYGVAWLDTRTGARQVWLATLDSSGVVMRPPGEVQVSFQQRDIAQQFDLGWSGGEFLAAWTNLDSSVGGLGKIMGARVSSLGGVLETEMITSGPNDDEPRAAWNGRSWGVAVETGTSTTPNVYFVQVDCNCTTDADHDGILPCGGGDCDDSDPTVGAGLPEICDDGKDNNCDGLVDCNDPTCAQNGNPPLEIGGVNWSGGKATLSWISDSRATSYDVARGALGDLRDMQNFKWTACLASKVSGTSTNDTSSPPSGGGFYYVIRGRARTCLLGTWGTSLRDGTLHGCP